jgi:uncharacterized protein YraI
MKSIVLTSVAVAALVGFSAGAFAQSTATATADLNIRSGPGPQHQVIGVINASSQTTVTGCLEGSKWCKVDHNGTQGWAYSDYLTADLSGAPVVLTERYAEIGVPVATYEASASEAGGAAGATTGAVGGAVAGALIGGPIGAVAGAAIGGAAGGVSGAATGAVVDAISPPDQVTTYVRSNPVDPVYLEGEVVVGAGLPETVQLRPVPDYEYNYVYVNGQPVLVEPQSRRIVYVVR